MNVVRVNFLPRFHYGDDAVLLSMDGPGVATFLTALDDAVERGTARLDHDGTVHDFVIEAGRAGITLDPHNVTWRLDSANAREMADLLRTLTRKGRAGHGYVDISTPALTLVISRDEYLGVDYPWISPPTKTSEPPTADPRSPSGH